MRSDNRNSVLDIGTARSSRTAATVDRALDLLAVLRESEGRLGVRDLARRLALSPATIHRLLASLLARGFVTQADDSRAYGLGWAFLDYASTLQAQTGIVEVAGPIGRTLRDATGETVTVQVPVGLYRVCILELEGSQEIRRRVGLGRRVPLHAGASSRAILAFMSTGEIERAIEAAHGFALTPQTETNPGALRRLLEDVRRSGLSFSSRETVEDVMSMATPLFDATGAVMGSLAVSGPRARWTREAMAPHHADLVAAGIEISRRLGFRGSPPWFSSEAAQQDGVAGGQR